ncbi:glycoside hydrolase family 3 protein [Cognatilysobacter bugurensis]|uniref:Glucan 1,4-beta-glucosidase n=1 Tax=Cognatilysobacter bugurensis TaxID=543356 RepID=A0A918SYH8_9GAMM|nr:exo 1,3/1,4-beta-D-glucan glucohydrolase [Lysobacter bugurensis]GHA79122.1 glucan 1,4-beta-glucosidase [Lysobacter bugurensis]
MLSSAPASQRASHRSLRTPTVLLSLCVALCLSQAAAQSTSAPAADAALSPVATPAAWPQMSSPLAPDPRLEARIKALLAEMSVEDKVGQVVQGDLGSLTPEDVRTYRLGSVLAGGNSDPGGRYNSTGPEWLALADALYRASMDTSGGRKPIPVLLGIDAVHGHNNVVGATLFPHNIGLGAAHDADLVRRIAQATAAELRTTGFEWTFAPTVTVPRDDRWGRTYEGYSEDPALVSRYATAVVEGLQGEVGSKTFLGPSQVVASSKHFIGDGGTFEGKDKGDTRVSEAELRDVHGAGHIAALKAGTQTVMASFSSWNGEKMHGNRSLLTDVLKDRLGFDGFVVGDWNGHGEVTGCTNESCPEALIAGIDMFMAPDSWKGVYTNTLAQVKSGKIPMQRLDDAVARILRVKLRLGLFDAGAPSERALGGEFERLGSAEHRALAREAVRKSLVLLKNNGSVLPLKPDARILVAGDGAGNVGKQAGGWTLSWQGTGTTRADFPNATSIWEGIEQAVKEGGGRAELSVDGTYKQKPDAAIVVFGEEPYAEFIGDVPNLAYQPGKGRDLALLQRLKAEGIPVVAVFLSGRPMWVNREINAADAFVAAWLPGSEGGGVADVLFRRADGTVAHDFTGTLPFSWPKTAVQTPLNVGQPGYDPLFPVGYGLSYGKPRELAPLSEESGLRHGGAEPGLYFARGAVAPGWTLTVADGSGKAQTVRTLPTRDLARNVAIRATDHEAQEDARRIQWSGSGAGIVAFAADEPVDLTRESNAGATLVATVKVDAPVRGAVPVGIGCGTGCSAQVDLAPALAKVPHSQWQRVAIPLACFARAGADLSRVSEVFRLSSKSVLDLSVSRVALGTEADQTVACPAP